MWNKTYRYFIYFVVVVSLFVIVMFIILAVVANSAHAADTWPVGQVTLAWDANVEPDLAGYKIYAGKASRKTADPAAMVAWCTKNEPNNTECLKEWQAICKDPADQACHIYLFPYDRFEDVKNVIEYTLGGLELETPYYLAAIAYDEDGNASLFSEELIHTVYVIPAAPGGIKGRVFIPAPSELHVTKEQTAITFEHDPGE